MNNKLKTIFFGTPQFATAFLESLIADPDIDVTTIITQPNRPSGRKQALTPPPVKVLAEEKNIKIIQPETLKDNQAVVDFLQTIKPDMAVVVAYGEIIPQVILDIPKFGSVNVHPSLLPKYRGASPIQSAILNGDKKTGISIMLLDAKMDHGPILAQREVVLAGNETNESLHNSMAEIGSLFLIETIKKYLAGELKPCEQNHDQAVYCQEIKKDDAKIDWLKSAEIIERKIRAFYPWPITWTTLDGKRLKIVKAENYKNIESSKPGEINIIDGSLIIGCGQGSLKITELQLAGKKIMNAKEFIAGHPEVESMTIN